MSTEQKLPTNSAELLQDWPDGSISYLERLWGDSSVTAMRVFDVPVSPQDSLLDIAKRAQAEAMRWAVQTRPKFIDSGKKGGPKLNGTLLRYVREALEELGEAADADAVRHNIKRRVVREQTTGGWDVVGFTAADYQGRKLRRYIKAALAGEE